MNCEPDGWEPWLILDEGARGRVSARVSGALNQWVHTWCSAGAVEMQNLFVSLESRGQTEVKSAMPGIVYRDSAVAREALGIWLPDELLSIVLGCHRDYICSPLSDSVAQGSVAARVRERMVSALGEQLLGDAGTTLRMTPSAMSLDEQRSDPAMRHSWTISVTMRDGCALLSLLCSASLIRSWSGVHAGRAQAPGMLVRRAEAIGDTLVPLQVTFKPLELPVVDLAGLEAGDVLLFEPGDDECLNLQTGAGECIATVSLGRQRERRALAISKLHAPSQPTAMRRVPG